MDFIGMSNVIVILILACLVGIQTVRVVRKDRQLIRAQDSLRGEIVERKRLAVCLQLIHTSRFVSWSELAAGLGQELNQPLSAVSTAAEDVYLRLTEGIPLSDEELKPIMLDVLSMVDRMSGTIDYLRMFSTDSFQESDEYMNEKDKSM